VCMIWNECKSTQIHLFNFAGKQEILHHQFTKKRFPKIGRPIIGNGCNKIAGIRDVNAFLRIPMETEMHPKRRNR
jgi:hypothetical protein